MDQQVRTGQISDSNTNIINKQLSDSQTIISCMEKSIDTIKQLKQEMSHQKILKMQQSDKSMSNYYPCEYDYIVKEEDKYYLVYGWKQTMIDMDLLPVQGKTYILKDFCQKKMYQERINRLPLTDLQVNMFEMLLEDSLTTEIIDELQMLYKMKKIEPVFKDDDDGYKKKIFEKIVKYPQKFTVKVGGLRIDINPGEFLSENNLNEHTCTVNKRKIDQFTCELFIDYSSLRQYRQTFNKLKAQGYDLQETDKHNQTIQILVILKQLYAEVQAKNYQQICTYGYQTRNNNKHLAINLTDEEKKNLLSHSGQKEKSQSSSNSRSRSRSRSLSKQKSKTKTNSAQSSFSKISSASKLSKNSKRLFHSPQGFKLPIVESFEDNKLSSESMQVEKNSSQLKTDALTETACLVNDVEMLFQYLMTEQRFAKIKIPMNTIKKGLYMNPAEVLDLNSKYFMALEQNNSLTEQQELDYQKIITLKMINNFMKQLKNQNFDIKQIAELKLLK